METYAAFLEQGPDLPYPQWVDDEGNLRIFAIGDNEDFFGKDALRVMTLQVACWLISLIAVILLGVTFRNGIGISAIMPPRSVSREAEGGGC
jgi:hypothetical protein